MSAARLRVLREIVRVVFPIAVLFGYALCVAELSEARAAVSAYAEPAPGSASAAARSARVAE